MRIGLYSRLIVWKYFLGCEKAYRTYVRLHIIDCYCKSIGEVLLVKVRRNVILFPLETSTSLTVVRFYNSKISSDLSWAIDDSTNELTIEESFQDMNLGPYCLCSCRHS